MEGRVHNERCTPGSEGGFRKPTGESQQGAGSPPYATTYRSWQVLQKSCAKPRAKIPQPMNPCSSDGRARSARGEVAGRVGPSVAQRRVTKLGSVRPSDLSVHACSKVSKCSWSTL